jgi:hypothetical protein
MDTVLDYLTKQITDLEIQIEVLKKEKEDWIEYKRNKSDGSLTYEETIPRKASLLATTTRKPIATEANATMTMVERVMQAFKDNNGEMFSSQIAEQIKHHYKRKPLDWLLRRISSILSDEKNKSSLYSYHLKEKGQHHLAKVWGLNEFKDKNGQVKEEHKYKSTQLRVL